MKIKQEVIHREILGEHFLIPIGAIPEDQNGLFALTEWGAFIWELLPDADSEEEILQAILDEYEVEREIAEKDLSEFLKKLRDFSVIE